MNIRSLLFVGGIVLVGAVLLFAGGFAEVELLTDSGSGYLPQQPTAAAEARVERRYGSR
jgi:hypothetical protein